MNILYNLILEKDESNTIVIAIIIGIYKAIQGFKNYVNRNKEMEKKIDIILNKLENKKDN
ncbi:hypothetical protein LGK96_08945 [Clostridium estertheticum]|uniref:Uncharacterized protein n=1 Tax=Clostridium estertheticum TaxID=238834 RepID=A0A7Y3SWF3_9CLOT|nr:hypothetical protein [Clostridium estertheticum]MCB2340424.1 hypothetical protein [Clostridium estertheticum]NNU76631.1 hypothetical protein [Clostridium estertheticum]WBL49234.1 hypothetical protein LOR37_11720 [Clostridium estertheticum]